MASNPILPSDKELLAMYSIIIISPEVKIHSLSTKSHEQ